MIYVVLIPGLEQFNRNSKNTFYIIFLKKNVFLLQFFSPAHL